MTCGLSVAVRCGGAPRRACAGASAREHHAASPYDLAVCIRPCQHTRPPTHLHLCIGRLERRRLWLRLLLLLLLLAAALLLLAALRAARRARRAQQGIH